MFRVSAPRDESLVLILRSAALALWGAVHRCGMMGFLRQGAIMFRFIGGVVLGIVVGLYLGSIPAVSAGLAEVGKVLSISALATLL